MNPPDERHGILCGGNWIIDHVKMVDRYPEQDALASILDQSRGTGGAPYNVLIDLSKLGAPFSLAGIGLVGDDDNGRAILADCRHFGIDASQVHTTRDAPTSFTDVMTVEATGRRTFFHRRGANSLLDESHFKLDASHARIFHLGYLLLLDTLDKVHEDGTTGAARLLQRARALGFKTAVDLVSDNSNRFASVVTPALPHIDYLVINEYEAAHTSGIEVTVDGAPCFSRLAEAARTLLDMGVHEWVVIHCPEGALARHHDGTEVRQGSVRVDPGHIAGTAGAGDAFSAGMMWGLHENFDMQTCLRMAVCAATSNLSDPTCTGGIQSLETCLSTGEQRGFHTC